MVEQELEHEHELPAVSARFSFATVEAKGGATMAIGFIKNKLADQLIDGIRYQKIDEWYEMTQFEAEIETWADYIVPSTEKNSAGGTHIYNGVPFDSETIEKPFIQALEKRKDVKLYIKLPSWFTVTTPIGAYEKGTF